jgi:hypothetical protein
MLQNRIPPTTLRKRLRKGCKTRRDGLSQDACHAAEDNGLIKHIDKMIKISYPTDKSDILLKEQLPDADPLSQVWSAIQALCGIAELRL